MDKNKIINNKKVIAKASAIKVSPRKLALVIKMIKNMKVFDAMLQLRFSKKKVSKDILMLLKSAIANAENNFNLDIDKLYLESGVVGKAFELKRNSPRARGRAGRIKKPFSNLTIYLDQRL